MTAEHEHPPPPQLAHHLPAAEEGIFEKQFIDAAHQRRGSPGSLPGARNRTRNG